MGNSCNFECEYCLTQLHDGSLGWHETNKYVDIIEKICKHYQEQDKVVNFEFIGGEVTVTPGFIEILEKVKEYNGHNIIFTNGSRTVNWWSKAKHLIDDLIISFTHLQWTKTNRNVAEEIRYIYKLMQFAGVKDSLSDIELLAERLRTVYRHSTVQDYYGVNIAIKTMYKKLLGPGAKQDTYYDYDGNDWRILNLPTWKENPDTSPVQIPNDTIGR